MIAKLHTVRRYHTVSLSYDDLLYETIEEYCKKKEIRNGTISAIGALQNVNLGYYDQKEKKYNTVSKNEGVEIVHCVGNISMKDDEIFVHLHIAVADNENKLWGGHLMSGSKIFACEVSIVELRESPFYRKYDETTGLFLWKQ